MRSRFRTVAALMRRSLFILHRVTASPCEAGLVNRGRSGAFRDLPLSANHTHAQ